MNGLNDLKQVSKRFALRSTGLMPMTKIGGHSSDSTGHDGHSICIADGAKRAAWADRFGHRVALCIASLSLGLLAMPAQAARTTTWSATSPNTSTTTNGVVVQATSTSAFTGVVTGAMNTFNFWNDSHAAVPTASIGGVQSFEFLVTPVTTQTVTFTFSEAVDNPIIHIDRMGGASGGLTNSSNWQLVGSNLGTLPGVTRLAGNQQFRVTGNSFFRPNGVTSGATGCSNASATAATDDGTNACGSVRYTGTGITSLTFTVTFLGPVGAGDGIEMVWSIGGSRISIAKQSVNGTRAFSFTGTNGVSSVTLDTAVANPSLSAFFDVADHRQPITITDASVSDYILTGVACVDQNSVAVPATLSGQAISIAVNDYRGNQNIRCTFTNRRFPSVDLSITKSNGVSVVYSGSSTTYTVEVTNSGPDPITGAVVTDIPGAGVSCLAASPVVISGSGVPAGSFTIANLTGAGITLGTLANGQSATLTFSCGVN